MARAALAIWAAAILVLSLVPAHAQCTAGDGEWIERACFGAPLTQGHYGHDVLGGTPEWTRIEVTLTAGGAARLGRDGHVWQINAGPGHIFEDIAPRIVQLDGAGPPEIIAVDSSFDAGARLIVVDLQTDRIAATPHIGRPHRWLAPIGAADLDGDGRVEIAYIDRPHLAKTLVIWRYVDGALAYVTDQPGFTNHRIGENSIAGGIRDCGEGPEMIVADGGWREVLAVTLRGRSLDAKSQGPHRDRSSFAAAMACK